MIKVSVQRTGRKDVRKLRHRVRQIDRQHVEIGYFDGETHQDSDLTYASLMAILEFGSPENNIPARYPFHIVAETNRPNKDPKIRKAIKGYLSNLMRKEGSDALLDYMGKHYRDKLYNIFGKPSRLEPNAPSTVARKGKNTPLVDEGDLREELSYKTSKNGSKRR